MSAPALLLILFGGLMQPTGAPPPLATAQQTPQVDARAAVMRLRETGRYAEALAAAERGGLDNLRGELLVLVGRRTEAEQAFRAAERGRDSLAARLNRGRLLWDRGQRADARRLFDTFIDAYNSGGRLRSDELTAVGTAVRYLSIADPQLARDALRAYDQAVAADSTNLEPRLATGELFLDKYNSTDAREAFQAVARRSPEHPRALLGMAQVARFEGSAGAADLVRRSLAANPNLVPARVLLARMHLEGENYNGAASEIGTALAVDSNALEAIAVLAAARYLQDDTAGFQAASRRALAINPRYAGLYLTLAEASARNRRYDAAARFARQAIALDPQAWQAHAMLGINRLRAGDIAGGRASLETAFAGDPFDVWTKNTLDLLDTLQQFREVATDRFRLVMDGKEADLLALYAGPLADEAYARLSARYGVRPAVPVRVEFFPNHADFSVRTVGLAGLGALGVSFGPVIAMDSPSARPAGTFNWGSTLWHEIAHTFHMTLSAGRVPRWLTEGLAVLEERRARAGWGDDVNPAFLAAYRAGRLLPVSRLNDGFVRPDYPEQVAFSYLEASLVCEYIEETHGASALLAMLRGHASGKGTADVVREVLGQEPDAFDAAWDAWFQTRYARELAAVAADSSQGGDAVAAARARPGDFAAQLAAGRDRLRRGDAAGAIPFLERAKTLFPGYAEDDGPYRLLARIHRSRGDLVRAAAELQAMSQINESGYGALLELAALREELGDTAAAAAALDRAMYISPLGIGVHERLAGLYERLGRWPEAVRERRAVVALGPTDRAEALYRLAQAWLGAGSTDEARRSVVQALEVAPGFARAQDLLLDIQSRRARGTP